MSANSPRDDEQCVSYAYVSQRTTTGNPRMGEPSIRTADRTHPHENSFKEHRHGNTILKPLYVSYGNAFKRRFRSLAAAGHAAFGARASRSPVGTLSS